MIPKPELFPTMQAVLCGLLNLPLTCQQVDRNQFLQKLDRNTKIHFAYMLKKFRTAAALDFM
jgi:hypothetical protein